MKVEDVVLHCSGMINGATRIAIMQKTENGPDLLAIGGKYDTPVTAYYGNEVSRIYYFTELNGLAIWITH